MMDKKNLMSVPMNIIFSVFMILIFQQAIVLAYPRHNHHHHGYWNHNSEYSSCTDVASYCRSRLCDSTHSSSPGWDYYTGIDIMTFGVMSPLPTSENRYSTGFVLPDGTFFMIDAGTGVARDLGNYKCKNWTPLLKKLALTHYHSDHIGDVGFLLNIGFVAGRHGPEKAVDLYGPEGLSDLASAWRVLYADDAYARVTAIVNGTCVHVGNKGSVDSLNFVPHEFNINSTHSIVPLFTQGSVNVTAMLVPHDSIYPAVGYVLQTPDVKIVVSGDTTPSEMVETMSHDADYLVHEVMNLTWVGVQYQHLIDIGALNAQNFYCNVPEAHTPIEAVAGIAQRARVKNLILTHMVPAMDSELLSEAVRDAGYTYGNVYVASDGDYWKVTNDEEPYFY